MLAIVGTLIVIAAIVGGYLLEKGNLHVLLQPAELLIIGGAAFGTLLIANPLHVLGKIAKGLIGVLKGSPYTKPFFTETLRMLFELFTHVRKVGFTGFEGDVDNPSKSQLFTKYPRFLRNIHAVRFVCDTLRTISNGGVSHHELEQLMDMDIEVHHKEESQAIGALSTVADSLPGLGIVAAVLGVVITMGALGGPPEEIGHKVAAALVGTFLGILLCYGFIGPLAQSITKISESEQDYYRCLQQGVVAFAKGVAPILAVEFARRAIPNHVRPTFQELESTCRGGNGKQQ